MSEGPWGTQIDVPRPNPPPSGCNLRPAGRTGFFCYLNSGADTTVTAVSHDVSAHMQTLAGGCALTPTSGSGGGLCWADKAPVRNG